MADFVKSASIIKVIDAQSVKAAIEINETNIDDFISDYNDNTIKEDSGDQTITGVKTFSSDPIVSGLTADRAMISSSTKELNTSSVTSTELGYVGGVTSGIQTQFNAEAKAILTAQGDILFASGANTLSRLAKGSARQILTMNSGETAPEWSNPYFTLDTPVNSTSGTAITFTGLLSGLKEIKIMFDGVGTNGTSNIVVELGDSGGFETSGYKGSCFDESGATKTANASNFIVANNVLAALSNTGVITLNLMDSSANTWAVTSLLMRSDNAAGFESAGTKSLSGELTQLKITMANGTDVFDAGKINILKS